MSLSTTATRPLVLLFRRSWLMHTDSEYCARPSPFPSTSTSRATDLCEGLKLFVRTNSAETIVDVSQTNWIQAFFWTNMVQHCRSRVVHKLTLHCDASSFHDPPIAILGLAVFQIGTTRVLLSSRNRLELPRIPSPCDSISRCWMCVRNLQGTKIQKHIL